MTAALPVLTAADGRSPLLRSPIRWVGGKLRLRRTLLKMLPHHECYVEVFGGAAWLLLAKDPSPVEVLNDIDSELMNFFEVVRDRPEKLIKSFDFELVSRHRFERLRDLSAAKYNRLSAVGRAHRFYYLIMASWGAELGSPRFQTSISDEGHGNRLAGALKTLRSRIEPIHCRLRTVLIENGDWRKCIDRYDDARTVMYLDPPYAGNGCNYKHNMRGWTDHAELVDRLRSGKSRFILSGYDSAAFRKICRGLKLFRVDYASGMPVCADESVGRRRNAELLVTNFSPFSAQLGKSFPRGRT